MPFISARARALGRTTRWARAAGLVVAVCLAGARADAQGTASAEDAIGWGEPTTDASRSEAEAASDAVGFGGPAPTPPRVEGADRPREDGSLASVGGTLRFDSAIWSERLRENAFAKARASVDLWLRRNLPNGRVALGVHGEYDFAYLYRRDEYDPATLDTYEHLVRAGENFVALERPRGGLSVGTQVVVFGHADMLSIVDMVNPRDLRETVLTDPTDVRVPALMTKMAYAPGQTRVELIVVHEAWFELLPPPFGEWSPIRRPILEDPRVAAIASPEWLDERAIHWEHHPRRLSLESQQVFGRLTTNAGPVDLGFYGGYYRDPIGTVTLPPLQELLERETLPIRLDHLRMQTVAASLSFVHGSVVGWAEAAVDVRRPVNVEHAVELVATERRTLFRFTAGVRYHGAHGGIGALEYAQGTERGPGASDAELLVPTLPTTLAFRAERAFARDRLRARVVAAATGERLRGGALGVVELAWSPRDGLSVGAGYAHFTPLRRESSLIWGYTSHDRAFARVRYDFAR